MIRTSTEEELNSIWYLSQMMCGFEDCSTLLAFVKDVPAGFCRYTDEEILWIIVLPCFRRQGLGREMIDYVKAGKDRLRAFMVDTSIGTDKFWSAHGFIPLGDDVIIDMEWTR